MICVWNTVGARLFFLLLVSMNGIETNGAEAFSFASLRCLKCEGLVRHNADYKSAFC